MIIILKTDIAMSMEVTCIVPKGTLVYLGVLYL